MKRNLTASTALILALIASAAAERAEAYIPPADYILKKYVKMRTGIESIWVKSKISAVVDGETTGIHFFDVTTYDPASQTVQSLAYSDENKLAYVKTVKLTQPSEGQAVASRGAAVPTYLFFVDNPSLVLDSVISWGIPIKVEPESYEPVDFSQQIAAQKAQTPEGQEFDPNPLLNLIPTPATEDTRIRRWKETLAWVFGKSDSGRQLWVEKDSFLPLRLMASEHREVQFEKYRFMKNYPYPASITLHESGEAVLVAELNKVVVNAPVKDFPLKRADGPTEDAPGGRVQTLIERFYSEVR